MNAVIQYQHIHALLGLVLLHELEQFPVKIPKIHHIDRLIVRREQRDHAVRIGILDHKKRLARVIAGMNLYKGMIIIQEKSVLVLGLQIFRRIQRVRRVCEIIGDRYRLFLRLGKYCILSFVQATLIRDCSVP